MHSSRIYGGELRGQPANPGSPGKMAIEMVCVCVYITVTNGLACYFLGLAMPGPFHLTFSDRFPLCRTDLVSDPQIVK